MTVRHCAVGTGAHREREGFTVYKGFSKIGRIGSGLSPESKPFSDYPSTVQTQPNGEIGSDSLSESKPYSL